MSNVRRVICIAAATGFAALIPVGAGAAEAAAATCIADPHSKAQIEHCEMLAFHRLQPPKPHDEAASSSARRVAQASTAAAAGSDAPLRELGLSALTGAAIAGGAILGTQRIRAQRRPA